MNILHLSCVAPPQIGGVGQVASEQVKRLRALGHEVVLIAPYLKHDHGEEDPAWVVRKPAIIRWGNAAALGNIDKELKKADVVHVHYPFYGTAEKVAQYCLWHRKPLVMTFHMDATAPFPLGFVFDLYRVVAQPAVLRACKKIFVSSFDYADTSSVAGFKRAHPERFVELPFGVDRSLFRVQSTEHRAQGTGAAYRFGVPEGVPIIGFAGAMDFAHRFKGAEELLEAAKTLPEAHLLLIGGGDRKIVYEALAKEFGIAERCHFVGRLNREDLARAYQCMDVFAFPSTNGAEAFGLVAAEALACGVPVVASSLPGVRTVVKDKETGLLIPPRDVPALQAALAELLQDSGKRAKFAKNAAADAAERFDWDKHVGRLVEVYRKLI